MQATRDFIGHTMTFTPWCSEPPTRPGWYVAIHDSMRSFFDGAAWSAPVEADASDGAHDRARGLPLLGLASGLRWRGLSADSHAWLTTELAR